MNTTKQKIALLEQGVNGIAEMYADLSGDLRRLAEKRDVNLDVGKIEDRLSALESALDQLKAQFASIATKVADITLQAKADYYTRGVLDEYMYGVGKEEQWKTT